MCTVIVEVPRAADGAVRVLAVRDEDPDREWDAPGQWWPSTRPGVRGVRDRRANGAWLAAAERPGRLAVILNRAEEVTPSPGSRLASRGDLVLESVSGGGVPTHPATAAFNLIEIAGAEATVTSWDGSTVRTTALTSGVHMIAHHDLDDPRTARITRWLPEFAALSAVSTHGELGSPASWSEQWIGLLNQSAELRPDDDEAIIRDNRAHGYPTLSLLVCVAEITDATVSLGAATLPRPGVWTNPTFVSS